MCEQRLSKVKVGWFLKVSDVIHANHTRKARHSGRLLTYKELALSYANITMEQVICFIDLCNTCAAKKNKIK